MSRERKLQFIASAVLLSILFAIGAGEVAARVLVKSRLDVWDERNLMYQYDAELEWFPVAGSDFNAKGDAIHHNSRGFRDIEHVPDSRPGIVFLGDSFVWGYGVGQHDLFTKKLRDKLPQASAFNLGVSVYGTDQEYLLLQKQMDFYKPRIVFLEFTTINDPDDNSTDMRYGTYYKPYFMEKDRKLQLCGVPVPKSFNYFIAGRSLLSHSYLARLFVLYYYKNIYPTPPDHKNLTHEIIRSMRDYVSQRGAVLLVGIQVPYPELEKLLASETIPYLDLSTPLIFKDHGMHWTPRGHEYVSGIIADFILKGKYLQ